MQIETCVALVENVARSVRGELLTFIQMRQEFDLWAPLPEADVDRVRVLAVVDSSLFRVNKSVIPAILDFCKIVSTSYRTDGAFRDAYAVMRCVINRWLEVTHNMAVDRELHCHAGMPLRMQLPTIDELYEQHVQSNAQTGPVDLDLIAQAQYPPLGDVMRGFYWQLRGDNCWHLDVERLGDLGADIPSIPADEAADWYGLGQIYRLLAMAIMRRNRLLVVPAEAVPDRLDVQPYSGAGDNYVEVMGTSYEQQMTPADYTEHQEFFEAIYLTFLRRWAAGGHFVKDDDQWVSFPVTAVSDRFGPAGARTAAGRNGCIYVTIVNSKGLPPVIPKETTKAEE